MMTKQFFASVLVSVLAALASAQQNDGADYADALNAIPAAASLADHHKLLASEPHIAGTPGDWRTIERLIKLFTSFGLDVTRHDIWVYLASPVEAQVQVLPAGTAPIDLPLIEPPIASDPDTAHPDLTFGWNGYSGSGDVTAELVYANYGRLEDFQKLEELGVSCQGKIVIARYGGNFRGYKAKFAQAAGAIGLIIYTDPADSGYVRGIPWPEGGYANEHSIQRGSIGTLAYRGDPLTPFIPAEENATRLDPESVALPKIPVQPLGWAAAHEILSRMSGPRVPDEWQGGLPIAYRLEGGADLRVRVRVEQQRKIVKTANVIAEVRGQTYPDEVIVVGCHHDAWCHGASDPLAGLICLVESARSVGALARDGWKPDRTIRFAAWAAEEQGIIGSTEYVEAFAEELTRGAVAYINLDMAAMGPNFRAAGAPSLVQVITAAARSVSQARQPDRTVFEAWAARRDDQPALISLGSLGGGSDHVGFSGHLCIPSAGLSAGGAAGSAYHSNYDTLAWYRKTVGDDYEPALMITRMTNAVIARLAGASLLPLDPSRYALDVQRHLDHIASFIADTGAWGEQRPRAIRRVELAAELFRLHAEPVMLKLAEAELDPKRTAQINRRLILIERAWCDAGFETGRSWYRSGYAAPDESSGYAPWMLPALRHAVALGDPDLLEERADAYERFFARAGVLMGEIEQLLP
ncbi:MAG: M28 family peptidase [Planctomycetota bacterium]|nr:MAG: M28 family peptidase [Planctomycetota bacterium]